MKFSVTMKCPDVLRDTIEREAENQIGGPSDSEEHDELFKAEVEKALKICEKWFKYSEYITVYIDTEEETCSIE